MPGVSEKKSCIKTSISCLDLISSLLFHSGRHDLAKKHSLYKKLATIPGDKDIQERKKMEENVSIMFKLINLAVISSREAWFSEARK